MISDIWFLANNSRLFFAGMVYCVVSEDALYCV